MRTHIAIVVLAAAATIADGQSDRLYITVANGNLLAIVQDGELLELAPTYAQHFAIAVTDTVWIADYQNNTGAREYDLDGYATRKRTAYESVSSVDATTDGRYVYELGDAWTDHPTVYRLGMEFDSSSRVALFSLSGGSHRLAGITYDTASGNLWVSDDQYVFEYTMSGILVSQFNRGGSRCALAYEPSSDTLWIIPRDGLSILQYDKEGNYLGYVTIPGLPDDNKFGAEFIMPKWCPADLNNDGVVNTQDFIAYLNAWASGDPLADWNDDGTIDTRDFIAYLGDWVEGC